MEPSERVKCTFKDCKFYFESEKEMIRHKKKYPDHFYCSRCNEDFEDDTLFMIHQILSPKHIVCPSCGMEFKSKSGRDRHVEISHAGSQRLPCRGCRLIFTKASTLMRHIESDECRVIKLAHFQQERAERAIMKDAFQSILAPEEGTSAIKSRTVNSVYSDESKEGNEPGGVSLLESHSPHVERDWDGRPVDRLSSIRPAQDGPFRAPLPQPSGASITALDRYPPLPATKQHDNNDDTSRKPSDGDLMDVNEACEKLSKVTLSNTNPWSSSQNSAHLFPQIENLNANHPQTYTTDSKYDDLSEVSFRTFNSQSAIANSYLAHARSTIYDPPISHTQAPSTSHTHITTTVPFPRIPRLQMDKYYDPLLSLYICPGTRCNGSFPTPALFEAHLRSPAHTGGQVRCPSCLRMFKNNSALLTHMESGAKNCNVRNSTNYNQVLREVTAGLVGTSGHLEDGGVRYIVPGDEGWGGEAYRAGSVRNF